MTIDKSLGTNLKKLLKRGLQITAASFGRHTHTPAEPELLLLMYHRVLPSDDSRSQLEEPGMMVTPETFEMQMNIVKSLFDTVHLSDWLEKKNSGAELPKRCCAVTFDDGWADNYEFAFPVLQHLSIPATIFLVSDMIGENLQFWPGRMAHILNTIAHKVPEQWSHPSLDWLKSYAGSYTFNNTPPTQEQASEIIASAKRLSDEEIHHRLDEIENQLDLSINEETPALLDWQQVNTMCQSGLIEVGSHTCRHTRLTAEKDNDVLQEAVISSKATIASNTDGSVKTFCFPNGDHSESALSLVRQHYIGAVTTERGWNNKNSDSFLLRRIGVHEDISNDKTSFLSCISGWL